MRHHFFLSVKSIHFVETGRNDAHLVSISIKLNFMAQSGGGARRDHIITIT